MKGVIAKVHRCLVSGDGLTAIKFAGQVAPIIVAWVTTGTLGSAFWA